MNTTAPQGQTGPDSGAAATAETGPDVALVRAARARIGVRVGIMAGALVVLGAVLVSAFLWWKINVDAEGAVLPGGHLRLTLDPVDVGVAVLLVGAVAVLGAGLVGNLVAGRAVAPLARSLALQRQFVADASHELRTPLAVLSTRAQLLGTDLERAGGFDHPQAIRCRELQHDINTMVGMVSDMLQSSLATQQVPTTATVSTSHEKVDVATVVRDVMTDLAPIAAELRVDLSEGTPSPDTLVLPDQVPATAVRRCLFALLDNALTHTPPGGRVTVCAAAVADAVLITVHDTGTGLVGIQPSDVFARQVTGEPPHFEGREVRESHGLGLALVREVMARHGGTVSLDHTSPAGSSFTLSLPLPLPLPLPLHARTEGQA